MQQRIIKATGQSKAKTVAEGKSNIQHVRDRCKNGLHVSTVVHAERSIKQFGHMILATSQSLTAWYQKWNQACRSRAGSLAFHQALARAEEPLQSLLGVFEVNRDMGSFLGDFWESVQVFACPRHNRHMTSTFEFG